MESTNSMESATSIDTPWIPWTNPPWNPPTLHYSMESTNPSWNPSTLYGIHQSLPASIHQVGWHFLVRKARQWQLKKYLPISCKIVCRVESGARFLSGDTGAFLILSLNCQLLCSAFMAPLKLQRRVLTPIVFSCSGLFVFTMLFAPCRSLTWTLCHGILPDSTKFLTDSACLESFTRHENLWVNDAVSIFHECVTSVQKWSSFCFSRKFKLDRLLYTKFLEYVVHIYAVSSCLLMLFWKSDER